MQYAIPSGFAQQITSTQLGRLRVFGQLLLALYEKSEDMTRDEGLRIWGGVHEAYTALRESFIEQRSKRTVRGRHDTTLTTFLEQREHFRNLFYGRPGADGKRPGAADKQIRQLIAAYGQARDHWYPLSEAGKTAKAKTNKKQNKKPTVKAAKAAWAKSAEGKAWWAAYREAAKKKRAAAKFEAGLQDLQRLTEQHEAAEALANV